LVIDLRHLRYFVMVASTGNVSRAAAQLRVAQPAVSRQVRDLERELGVALLERHAKGVTPTLAGEGFARGAGQALEDIGSALDRAQGTADGTRGPVVIGALRATIARGFVPELEATLRREHPEITAHVEALDFRDVREALAGQSVDVAITLTDDGDVTLTSAPLWVESIDRALIPAQHPLARHAVVTIPELGELPLVLAHHGYPASLLEAGLTRIREHGLQSPILMLDAGLHAAHVAVSAGRGWTAVSRALASAPPEGTTAVPIEGAHFEAVVSAMWRTQERRPVVRTVLETAFRVARQYPTQCVPSEPRHLPLGPGRAARRRPPGTIPPELAIRHLRALLGVAAAQTIGRAAERLGVTQPALSRQLQELERATGLTLLDRTARGVMLTAAGSALAGDCPALLRSIERLMQEATRARRGMEGRCVIGAVATAATSRLLTGLLVECAERHPNIHIAIEEMPTPRQLPALARGDIDLGLAHASIELEDGKAIERQRIVDDRMRSALISATHALARRRKLDAMDLAEVPFLFMARTFYPAFYDQVMAALAAIGLTPRIEGTHDGLHTVWALAAQGKGWCLGFESQARRPPAGTVAVRIAGLDLPWGIDVISRKAESSAAVRVVASLLGGAGRQRAGTARHRR
jgi:DNA-binding transcriptional LysR family regulator